jgi:hypothetical protein
MKHVADESVSADSDDKSRESIVCLNFERVGSGVVAELQRATAIAPDTRPGLARQVVRSFDSVKVRW